MSRGPRALGLAIALVLAACARPRTATTGPARVDLPIGDDASQGRPKSSSRRELPPASGTTRESPFPAVARSKLANGMGLDVVTITSLPVVQLRLLVRAGSGYGPSPGVGELTVAMLKDGGTRSLSSAEVLRRVETLGADLSVWSDADASTLGMAATKDKLESCVSILAEVVREPRFDADELRKLKARTIDHVAGAARSDAGWTATWLVFHELFPAQSPYAIRDALPSQLAKVDVAQVRDFHRRFFVPKAATLVVAGDVDETTAKDLLQKHFGTWTGGDPPKVDFPPPKPIERTRVIVAHRPKSVQSDVVVSLLAPERHDAGWAHVRVANQVLGGGGESRLFDDLREHRSLSYSTRSQIVELGHGLEPLVVEAGTESSKTGQAALGLLENLQRMTSSPATTGETETARRFLADFFAIRMETARAIAEMVVRQEALGLPDDTWDRYRKELRATEAKDVAEAASRLFTGKRLIVVAGDADVVAGELARFGEVVVVDPEKEFRPIRTLPAARP